jgi:hypothetical protein
MVGAAIAPRLDLRVLLGTLLAFFFGTGIGAHCLDELKGRPLGTGLSDQALRALALAGFAGGLLVAGVGALLLSPLVWVWAAVGTCLAVGYALERPAWLHTTPGFSLAWGGFPVLVGYWAQAQALSAGAVGLALAATLLSATQRTLSTPARYVRRKLLRAELHATGERTTEVWEEARVLATWELPLRLLAWAMVALAVGLTLPRL